MRILSFLIFLLLAIAGQSQSLTQAFNEPAVGDVLTQTDIDTSGYTTGMPINQTGANISWDFTKLKSNSAPFTTNYIAPSATTLSAGFPGETVVEQAPGNFFMFIRSVKTPTTKSEVLGFASASMSATFTDPAIPAIFPMSMGSTITDNISGTFTVGIINGNCSGKITTVADGTGTLTLADGYVFKNVLRVKSVQNITASQGFFVGILKQTVINFYDASIKFPVLSINYSSFSLAFGTPTVSGFVTGHIDAFKVGIEEQNGFALLQIYPNPANDNLTIDLPDVTGDVTIIFYDCKGKEVKKCIVTAETKNNLDVSSLSPGLYNIMISSDKQKVSRKLIID